MVPTRFGLDTGIGITLLSNAFAQRLGVAPNGEVFVGRRMSGQALTVPLARVPSLDVGPSFHKPE